MSKVDNHKFKNEYKVLHRDLADKLASRFLLGEGMPMDEYNAEASYILARLDEADSLDGLRKIVYEEFSDFAGLFTDGFLGCDEISEWLWNTYKERKYSWFSKDVNS